MTYRFPAVLCSRISFRFSVRQVVSRVILRGSALYYFVQRPIWAHAVDGFFAQHVSDLLGVLASPTKEKRTIAVVGNDFRSVLVNRL